MTVRKYVERVKGLVKSELPQLREVGLAGLSFLMGMVMSMLRMGGIAAPFGVAAVASAGIGMRGVSALGGAVLGYLITGGLEWGIKYSASSVLAFTVGFVLQDIKISKKVWFMPLVAGTVMCITGILSTFTGNLSFSASMILMASESVLAICACYLFSEALSKVEPTTEAEDMRHDISVLLTLACALGAMSSIKLFGIVSIGRVLALLILLAVSFRGGSKIGATGGTVFGLVMDACSGGVPFFTMAYAGSGILSSLFARFGRLTFVVCYILTNMLIVTLVWPITVRIDALFELFMASVIFTVIPPGTLTQICSILLPEQQSVGESGLRRYAARRVEGIATAYEEIYNVIRRAAEPTNDTDIAKVYDRAADIVCVSCKRKNECWNRDYVETVDALNQASESMTKRGMLEKEDIREHFSSSCEKLSQFVSAVNGELRALAYRNSYRARLMENRMAAWGQYMDFSEILKSLSRELSGTNGADHLAERRLVRFLRTVDVEGDAAVYRDGSGRLHVTLEGGKLDKLCADEMYLDKLSAVMGVRLCKPATGSTEARLSLLEAEPLAVSVGIAAMKKKGENVSGDRGTYFKTESGVLCVILSDGMGAGKPAARESIEAVSILERFLRSGVPPATAMKVLNSVMLLRNGDDWGFATIDLMCIDLFSGEAGFYKFGAAPSYVKNGKSVRRVKGVSMAAGLMSGEAASPDVVRMKLKPGSVALIASDGVITGEDAWIKDMLREGESSDTKEFARTVLKRAETEYGNADDMTVLCIRMEARA